MVLLHNKPSFDVTKVLRKNAATLHLVLTESCDTLPTLERLINMFVTNSTHAALSASIHFQKKIKNKIIIKIITTTECAITQSTQHVVLLVGR